jgi:hypothetical protein
LNLVGAAVAAILSFWIWGQRPWKDRRASSLLLILGALGLPQLYIMSTDTDFILADRYLFIILPYAMAIPAVLLSENVELARFFRRWGRGPAVAALALVTVCYAALDFREAPHWENDYSLMKHCSLTEESPKCVGLMLEKGFDRGHCAAIAEDFSQARRIYSGVSGWSNVKVDLPFYDGFCTVSNLSVAPEERQRRMDSLAKFYGTPYDTPLVFSKVLLHLERGDGAGALAAADYLNPQSDLSLMNKKIINVFRGQGQWLCSMPGADPRCREKMRTFEERSASVARNEGQIQWAARISMMAASMPLAQGH